MGGGGCCASSGHFRLSSTPEELAAQPGAAAGRHALLNDGHPQVGVLAQLVGAAEARGARTHNHHVHLQGRPSVHTGGGALSLALLEVTGGCNFR